MRDPIKILFFGLLILLISSNKALAEDFSSNTFLVSELNGKSYNNQRLWNFIKNNNHTGIQLQLDSVENNVNIRSSNIPFSSFLEKINEIVLADESRLIPVFIHYNKNILLLDSIINASVISRKIFYSPQGETWPSVEYLVQSNRRIIFFVEGNYSNESRVLHELDNYALQISANQITANSILLGHASKINLELFKIDNFDKLPTAIPPSRTSRNLVPDYINYLLETWMKVGKKPNFIFVGRNILNFDFIVDQLNSFTPITGRIRTSGKNLEKVYWKNSDILITGGKFSFPYRGGEEVILSPFAPGFSLSPYQIIITTEMIIPESYSVIASPVKLSEGMSASINFNGIILDAIHPTRTFKGENFSFSQDIDRGEVLRLPENASVNLGNPTLYGLPNSSFTVSCFVKFTEILEFGDNAILGNSERGYRRGMHLILRSGHPYFGLWANDFMSNEILQPNQWYHLTWRYIIETGEQAIFVNGLYVGSSDGHPAYSGTSDIHIGSAFSQEASFHGYIDNLYIWNRPLGNEEINRLSLDEEIHFEKSEKPKSFFQKKETGRVVLVVAGMMILLLLLTFVFRVKRLKKDSSIFDLPKQKTENKIQLFGEFKAINAAGENVSEFFTPKVKELFLYVLTQTIRKEIGAPIAEVNEQLWFGIDNKKVANNRSVTLNKLRKILVQFTKVEILSTRGYLQLKTDDQFFCDYIEAHKLCTIPEGMNRLQLESFFHLVKKGRLLKGINWPWLDEIRGFTGNQVIDNLLKLAIVYKKENKLREVEKVAQRILDYDALNEEAIYFQIWSLQKGNNPHLAKFNFNSFVNKYEESMNEPYSLKFPEFIQYYSNQF